MSLDPHRVFEHFSEHIALFTVSSDADIEDQFFERKEIPRPMPGNNVARHTMDDLKEAIRETVSAFANWNPEGGLLVLGISKTGIILGVNHLTELQRNDLMRIDQLLRNHSASPRLTDCIDTDGNPNRLLLIFVPETRDAICETIEGMPRAWKRVGTQNLPLTDRDRDQILRDKRVVGFEQRASTRYDSRDVDKALLDEIRKTWPGLGTVQREDTELLFELGAIERAEDGFTFTNAGLLFFATNPQRVISSAHIRILRYEASRTESARGEPTLDRTFTGSITHQLLEVRDFLRASGLLRVYQVRRPDGGFVEEPELPYLAIDEAIVNAVAHRDYALEWGIECAYYRDAFVVSNPGRLIQRSGRVPPHFRLDERTLQSTPRNPKLLEWLKASRDQKGQNFVRALSEGTRAMLRVMQEAKLPAPEYSVTDTETIVTLRIDVSRRVKGNERSSEFTNIYPLTATDLLPDDWRNAFFLALRNRLEAAGWFVDRATYGRLTAHARGNEFQLPENVRGIVRLYPAFTFAAREFLGKRYLVVDYTVEVKSIPTLARLLSWGFELETFRNRWAVARGTAGWREARIEALAHSAAQVHFQDLGRSEHVELGQVIPNLRHGEIDNLLKSSEFDLSSEIKRRSLSTAPASARRRAEQTQITVDFFTERLFPLRVGRADVALSKAPLRLGEIDSPGLFARTLSEPVVEFARHRETSNIREGITEFGAYKQGGGEVELVPVVLESHREQIVGLIERLKTGKFKYRGAERTFGTRFAYSSVVTLPSTMDALTTCARMLEEHPSWAGDPTLPRLFLVHTPEAGFASDDETAPYYTVKRLLLERGLPCQMVDSPTIEDPDWKDLNLALNIAAKCGVVPWVLPEGIADADFFIGLSYTQYRSVPGERLMGYANVFNNYGRWLFYSGNAQIFPFVERARRLGDLVEETLGRLSLPETPHVYFHYSARFSREDRSGILAAARRVRPQGIYSFVWINSHHPIRLYDERPESDGSLARGSYVVTGKNQIYISTTGYNPFRRPLGTPVPLEVTVWRYGPQGGLAAPPDLHALASQILALTKLNWASSDALTGEPITTKYAGDIAYLTAAFLRQCAPFALHPVLERTPWFL